MKTKFGFLERIRFTGMLTIIILAISVFLIYTHSFKVVDNVYTSDKINDVEYIVFENGYTNSDIENRAILDYKPIEDITDAHFGLIKPKSVMARVDIDPIEENGTYLFISTSKKYKDYIDVYNKDKQVVNSYPQKISYNPSGKFLYYLVPVSDTKQTYYILFDENYNLNIINSPKVMIGTEDELLLVEGYNSIPDIIFALALVLAGIFIYIMFHISSVEKYHIVKIFALSFFLISAQIVMFSQFTTFAFNQYDEFFLICKNILYYLTCASVYIIPYMYAKNKDSKVFYSFNIIATMAWLIISSFLVANGNPHIVTMSRIYNIYFIVVALGAFATNVYNYENETYVISVLRILSFISLVFLNLTFYIYQEVDIAGFFGNTYYLILVIYFVSVLLYICSIFYYRSKSMKDNKAFLYDEKATIDRIYNSNKKNITTKNIQEIAENILGDIQGIYPDLAFAMIIHRDINKNMTIPGYTEMKGDIERQAQKVFKRYYKKISNSTFTTHFSADTAVILFRSSNGELLMVYIKNNKSLTELDQIASQIFASPVLLSFNNCRIYDEITNTEKELLYAVGNLTYIKSENIGNIWRIGEYAYLLSKNTGLTEQVSSNLRIATYIHDIGKVGMSDKYINMDKITYQEEPIFYQHTQIGYDMLSKFSGDIMKLASICSLYHHEQYNGKGYLGKVADEVPIEARIAIICIEFENYYVRLDDDKNLTREELIEQSFKYLNTNKQTIFDPLLVQLFIKGSEEIEKIIEESEKRKN